MTRLFWQIGKLPLSRHFPTPTKRRPDRLVQGPAPTPASLYAGLTKPRHGQAA